MFEKEIEKYMKLNSIAESFGTVILGIGEDAQIPISELAASFNMDTKFYNRSAEEISVTQAAAYYDAVIKELRPERVILHLGSSDIELFRENAAVFDREYRGLIEHIRKDNKKCNIGIISLRNPDSNDTIKEINRHLCMIAQSQRCEYQDISSPRVWSPVETKNAMSFASALGLSKKANNNKSLYDLAKVFFGLNLVFVS